jgi:ubiquinone biosynthesis protein
MGRAGLEAARASVEVPPLLRRVLIEAERGDLEVGVRPEGFDVLLRRLERVGNRVVLGLLAGSFIVGLAMLTSVYRPPGWDQWVGVVFAIGFLISAALGAYLAVAVFRSGRG